MLSCRRPQNLSNFIISIFYVAQGWSVVCTTQDVCVYIHLRENSHFSLAVIVSSEETGIFQCFIIVAVTCNY